MPRTAGSTSSKQCLFCKGAASRMGLPQPSNRIIVRDNTAINYNTQIGRLGYHTCDHLAGNTGASTYHPEYTGYRHGALQSGTPTPTPAPTPEPTPEPQPIQEPAPTMSDPTFDFGGFIRQVVKQEMNTVGGGTDKLAALENLVDTIKSAATEAALSVTPRTHNYTVTADTGAVLAAGEGRPHMSMVRVLKSLARHKHIWLAGPAGSGKTTAASMAAKMLGLNYQEISVGPATSQWDLYGWINMEGQYVKGAMRDIYENGGVLMLDEIDNANPSVLVAINSALANGYANFPDARVKKHEDFVCIAGANTFGRGADRMYVGRNQIDGATLDRFKFLPFDYDEEAELDWAGHDQRPWVQFVQKVRHAAVERGMRVIVSPRASINGADELRDGDDWDTIAAEWIWNKMSSEDAQMLKAAIR